uniref:Uncharacterized protein n=1 Tax=Eutreptiella gymnastica TaxID=73025 RepID=A0A7S1I3B7_9EUGL
MTFGARRGGSSAGTSSAPTEVRSTASALQSRWSSATPIVVASYSGRPRRRDADHPEAGLKIFQPGMPGCGPSRHGMKRSEERVATAPRQHHSWILGGQCWYVQEADGAHQSK